MVVDVSGEVLFRKDVKARATGKRLYTACVKAYDWLCARLEQLQVPLLGVGYAVPGIVDPDERVVRQSIPLDIVEPEPIGDRLAEVVREPILVDNDANCCCWAEIVARKSNEPSSFLFVFGAWRSTRKPVRQNITAIGIGIAIDDVVHRGKDFSAGEFRSIEWKPGRTSQFSIADREIGAAREDGAVFTKMTKELARNTALVVNVLDLDDLYLGGFFSEEKADVRKIFEQEIQRNWPYPNKAGCEVRFSKPRGTLGRLWGGKHVFGSGLRFERGFAADRRPRRHQPAQQNAMRTRISVIACLGAAAAWPLMAGCAASSSSPSVFAANQVGYLPQAMKIIVVSSKRAGPLSWFVREEGAGNVVISGHSVVFGDDEASGQHLHKIDVSGLDRVGSYRLHIAESGEEGAIRVSSRLYPRLAEDALSYFYFHRLGVAIDSKYLHFPQHAHPALHPGADRVLAKDDWTDHVFAVRQAWADAGDFGVYPVNHAVAAWTLANLYERYGAFNDWRVSDPREQQWPARCA